MKKPLTISTHNGSRVCRDHNIRSESVVSKQNHIDPNGIHEIWKDEHPREAYKKIFGDSIREYNNMQSRKSRRIVDYYRQIQHSKNQHPVYEMIVSIGNSRGNTMTSVESYSVLKEFWDGWAERNPNLYPCGCYYHADEQGVPHLHIDYIPFYYRHTGLGPRIKTGLVRAFGEMGFEKTGRITAQIKWEHRENEVLEKLCRNRGYEVIHPGSQRHLDTQIFKAEKQLANVLSKYNLVFHALQHSIAIARKMQQSIEQGIDRDIER